MNTADRVGITCGIPLHAKVAACALAAAFCGSAQALTAAQCAALTTLAIPATTITGAALVPVAGPLPEYCRVGGRVDTEINFELRLPSNWNGKFYHQGGGGFVGSVPPAGPGLSRGYAAVATDTGHQGSGVQRTRPLCSYPKVAVHNGKGSPNSAASFSCEERGLGYSLHGFQSGQ